MARLAVALALMALLAGPAAAQQALNLNLIKGPGATLAPASVVGAYRGPITEAEFNTLAFNDKTGLFSNFDFSFDNSKPTFGQSFVYKFQSDGKFAFTGELPPSAMRPVAIPITLKGQFRVFVCNSKVRGQAQVVGTFVKPVIDPMTGAVTDGDSAFARLLIQTYKTKTSYFLAVQFFDADGNPQTVGDPVTGSLGKFILRQSPGESIGSPLTTPIASRVAATCGFQSINAV